MPNLRKMEITIGFNGNFLLSPETFTDILEHDFHQKNSVKLAKCMLKELL